MAIGSKLKYDAVLETVRGWLESGRYGKNDRLPTDSELAQDFCVDRRTVAAGMRVLVREGLIARSPRRGTTVIADVSKPKSSAVALITNTQGDLFGDLFRGISAELLANSLYPVAIDNSMTCSTETMAGFIDRLSEREQPFGFLVQGYSRIPFLRIEQDRRLFANTVFMIRFHHAREIPGCGYVLSDTAHAGRLVVEHFARQGCRKVAFPAIKEPEYTGPYSSMQVQIMLSLKQHCLELGLEFNDAVFWRMHAGAEPEAVLRELFHSPESPDALFGYSDSFIAHKLHPLLRRISPNLPDEIPCVGMFNTPWSDACGFPSLDIRSDVIGSNAIAMLLGRQEKDTVYIQPELIIKTKP